MEQAKNIKDILGNDSYIIPRYQRNYAWGKAEIGQLIKDINEFFNETENHKSYYLGSLVCFKREDGGFELIDGQQRHTTITLINLVLKNWSDKISNAVSVSNLKFDSRKKAQNYIEKLYEADKDNFLKQTTDLNILGLGSFKDAIDIIREELQDKEIQKFAKNFYENVFLFRVQVPEDTDLNHYFEIMNNRGEQLEKHEIVKALLMGKLQDKKDQEKFAVLWDACSDMNDYVYFNFDASNRKNIFTDDSNLKSLEFHEITISIPEENNIEDNSSEENNNHLLSYIIDNHNIPTDFPKEVKYFKEKYKSVIDFPNFLLQVLKIQDDSVSLDDKKLIEQFSNIKPDSKEFIFNLLKYRVLFDKYIIKQDLANADESKQNWGIRKLNTDFEHTVKTYENDDELLKLQVMLFYSDSTNTYNNWVQEILKNNDFEYDKYTKKVWNITKDKFNKDNLSYPNISIYNLYFIDFLLWKLYAENIKGKDKYTENTLDPLYNLKKIINEKKEFFNLFKFRQLNSREHLFSQEHAKRYSIDVDIYNGIGNLCLISTSQNSAGNKENPIDKKKTYQTDNSSLKRLIMFESYENEKWESVQISKHQKEIEDLINNYLS